ncbi:hypothetical protein Bpfe_007980 [Biomphalaria pfeifferi]|uniref:Uncharacterized protein n=1 Tax=Biomphalaria pfeifferi TaxID=112525 RepID=A0AAD8BZM6_BIOPF|nr:hypothetical protein Bpfe_007980 [Biomphalaria pfeifferi]
MVRENRGHALETLPDIHPYEVDQISTGSKRFERFSQPWKEGITCAGADSDCLRRNVKYFVSQRPSVFFYDGRASNQLIADDFLRDPCKYYRNIYPWKPVGPKAFIPAVGHYEGLGKPPVRQYFKITPKQVQETRTMPTYEVYNFSDPCHYYKDTV